MHRLTFLLLSLVLGVATPAWGQFAPTYNCRTREAWSQDKKAWCALQSQREQYRPVNPQAGEDQQLVGVDPQAIALAQFGLDRTVGDPPLKQTVILRRPSAQRAIVLITQMGLGDDSIRGRRYWVELMPERSSRSVQWRLVWAGMQWVCQPERGSQVWGTKTCS